MSTHRMAGTATAPGAPAQASRSARAGGGRPDRWFFGGTALLQVALIVWGFSPTYYLRAAADLPPLAPLLHVHGAVFTAWLVLLVAQVSLVATGRTAVHRRLGVAGAVLAPLMFVIGVAAAIDSARRGVGGPDFTPEAFLIIPILSILGFLVLVGAALLWRTRPDSHKRLMMLATAGGLLGAGLGRIPGLVPLGPLAFLGIPLLFAVALMVFDWTTWRRIHRATLWGTILIVALMGLQVTAANSRAWLAMARWMIG